MIKFNGIGSAFNTMLGNTSAYIIEDDTLVLIDCGCTVFHRVKDMGLLKNIKNIYILLTHTHPDHAGSLGDIIFYAYYILNGRVNIFFRNREHLEKYFSCIGVVDDMYTINDKEEVFIEELSLKIQWVDAQHVDTMPSYSMFLTKDGERIYYSGDSGTVPLVVIEELKVGKISRAYQDTCSFDIPCNPHTSLKCLCNLFDDSIRSRVYCMHLDENLLIEDIKRNGFNVVEIE